MLLPALNQAREKARSSKCTSNLKQLMSVRLMYAMDYRDLYLCNDQVKHADRPWRGYVANGYLTENFKLMCCPSIPLYNFDAEGKPENNYYQTYGVKGFQLVQANMDVLDWVGATGARTICTNLKKIKRPSTYIQDGDSFVDKNGGRPSANVYLVTASYSTYGYYFMAHSGRMNVSLADGHVESIDAQKFGDYNISDYTGYAASGTATKFYFLDSKRIERFISATLP